MNKLNEIIEEFLSESSIDSLLELAVNRITKILSAERVTFYFYNQEVNELWSYAVTDLEISEIRVPVGKGIAGTAASRKRILNIEDAYKCSFFNSKVDKKTGYKTKSVLCAPLFNRSKKLLGVVQVINKKRGCFKEVDVDILKSVSSYLAISLENIRLLQEQEMLFRSTLYALAGAIDAKDPVTAGHSYRVAYYAVKMAKDMGVSSEELKVVEYAAYLHDVGKIGIAESVLRKKGRLTKEEYDLIKKHPLFTQQILGNIIFSKDMETIPFIASCHHEYLDGSGYPFGYKGKEVPATIHSIALQNVMGLICDPVANRVEVPCLSRNVQSGANALASANMILGGVALTVARI